MQSYLKKILACYHLSSLAIHVECKIFFIIRQVEKLVLFLGAFENTSVLIFKADFYKTLNGKEIKKGHPKKSSPLFINHEKYSISYNAYFIQLLPLYKYCLKS